MENKFFYITYKKEIIDTLQLAHIIKEDGWIDSSTIIVSCSPDYSSIPSQILNHKLSHLNSNELYEQLTMEMPYPKMSQVWNKETGEYQSFDRYLLDWMARYVNSYSKYLFLDSATIRGRNFLQVKNNIKHRTDSYRFASLYVEKDSLIKPSYYVQEYDKKNGNIFFEWENIDNPNWDY